MTTRRIGSRDLAKTRGPGLARRSLAVLLSTVLAFASIGMLPLRAEAADDLEGMRQQLAALTVEFNGLSSTQQASEDGAAASGLIIEIGSQFVTYDIVAAQGAQLQDQLITAQAQAARYAEGTVTRSVTSTGSIIKTYTATYTLSQSNPGGDLWRAKVGFGSGFTQVFTSTVLDTAGLTSTVGLYRIWQDAAAGTEKTAARAALEVAYGSEYTSAAAAADSAVKSAQNALTAHASALDSIESNIASQLIALAGKIENARNLRFKNTVVSDQVANNGTVYLAAKGDTASVSLSFENAFPANGGSGADFSDYTWKVSVTGADVVTYQLGNNAIKLTTKGALGTAQFSVTAVFNQTGEYKIADITPLNFSVAAIETMSFESAAVEAAADSTSSNTAVSLPPVKNAIGNVSYSLISVTPAEAYGRITLANDKIQVAKEANAGTYEVRVKAVDSKGYSDETTVALTVTNKYDAEYAAKLAQLKDIEAEIATLLSVAELLAGSGSDSSLLTALEAFAHVSDPLEAMWADGKPVVDEQSIRGFVSSLNAIGSVDPTIKVGTDLASSTLNGLSRYLAYLPLDKQTAMEGYYINLLIVKFDFPSVPQLYVDAVLAAWNTFQGQITPVTGLINAYQDLSAFVTKTDYSKLRDLHSINAYIQNLYFKYSAFDTALNVFNNSDSFLVPVVNSMLANVDDLVAMGLGLADSAARPALHGLVDQLIDRYLPGTQVNKPLKDLFDQGFDLAIDVAGESAQILPASLTLDDVVAYSGKFKAALGKIARASALTVSVIDFNYRDLLQYDYTKFSDWDEYATRICNDYRVALAEAAGPNAAEFTAELDMYCDQVLADPEVVASFSVYQDVATIYDFLVAFADYFSSGKAAQDIAAAKQALLTSLDGLYVAAISGGQPAFAAEVDKLKAQVRAAQPQELVALGTAVAHLGQQFEELMAAVEATPTPDPLAAPVVPATAFFLDAASSQVVPVSSTAKWTAQSSQPWLTVNASSGTATSATLKATKNASTVSRTATVTFTNSAGTTTVEVTQAGAEASLKLAATSWSAGSGAVSKSVAVTTNVPQYSVSTDADWLTWTVSGSNVTLRTVANPTTIARSATATVTAGELVQTVQVTQAGAAVSLSVAATSWKADVNGASTTIGVTTNAPEVTVTNGLDWVTVTVTGTTGVVLEAQPNLMAASRSGVVTVKAGTLSRNITVSQVAAAQFLAVETNALTLGSGAATIPVAVTTNVASISVTSSATSWVTVTKDQTGSVTLTVKANTTAKARTAKVTVTAGTQKQVIEVTQAAAE